MEVKSLYIKDFKNLKDFKIVFEEPKLRNVIIGINAAGKSNFLEALVIIFRDLELKNQPEFGYVIEYECNNRNIKILSEARQDKKENNQNRLIEEKRKYYNSFYLEDKKIYKNKFYEEKKLNLPKYVFAYYSGVSNRLEEHFDKHQRIFYNDLLKGKENPLRPLFYARPIHSNFVLMAFAAFPTDETKSFLKDYLFIDGIDSVMFVLKQPPWNKNNKEIEGGDSKFWYAKGIVKDILNDFYEKSIAPITLKNEKTKVDFRRDEKLDKKYLYIPSEERIKEIANNKRYSNKKDNDKTTANTNFFKYLESTYISDLIQEVRVRVRKIDKQGDVTFKEMSEGEQQLLTVLGLLKFTKSEESLFLLDEPDTHLNPIWQQEYLHLLKKVAGQDNSSQIILTSHNPLIINSLEKEEIKVFKMDIDNNVYVDTPKHDPAGMGVDAILTSDMFGLMTTLDSETYNNILKSRKLQVKLQINEISDDEKLEFIELQEKLKNIPYLKLYNTISIEEQEKHSRLNKKIDDNFDINKEAEKFLNQLQKDKK